MSVASRDPAVDPSILEAGVPAADSIFDGRFRIEGVIGRGGMGCVLSAMHLELQQRVALKLLNPARGLQERGSSRLLREARASARIRSEHVVRVLDVVQGRETPPYIVLEYLEGEDLARYLSKKGPLAASEAVAIILQACEAIGEAHGLGIVHRDLKPSNLFLCSRSGGASSVKVLDFGISKMEEAGASLTQSYALLGSPIYSAPEQLRSSHDVDGRADIWSLGIVLYECVTATRPFAGHSLAQICTSILHDAPRPPRSVAPQVPLALEEILLRCLQKNPAQRYASIEDLALALQEFAPRAAETCSSYLAALPRSWVARSSAAAAEVAHSAASATLTGSAEYDSHDRRSQAAHETIARRRWTRWGLSLLCALALALGASQLRRKIELGAQRASAPTQRTSAPTQRTSAPTPDTTRSSLLPASPATSLPPINDTPALPVSASAVPATRHIPSSRAAGPKRPQTLATPAPIAPWVDSR